MIRKERLKRNDRQVDMGMKCGGKKSVTMEKFNSIVCEISVRVPARN